MDHDEVEVSHRRTHHHRSAIGRSVELGHELRDEPGHGLGRRSFIDLLVPVLVVDEDVAAAPPAGALAEIVTDHHEVQAAEQVLVVAPVVVIHELKHERHRQAVALHRCPCLV
jgi:hypothetical protein